MDKKINLKLWALIVPVIVLAAGVFVSCIGLAVILASTISLAVGIGGGMLAAGVSAAALAAWMDFEVILGG